MAGTIKHEWNGTILTITSDSGTSSADLRGATGATGARGARGLRGERGNGATIEDGVIATDSTWSSSGIMDRFAEQIGSEGNPVVIKEPLPNFPYSITASFDVKQEGTGNPYPAGGGKNKLNLPDREAVEIAGVVVSCSNGAVSFKGTSTGTVYTNGKGIVDTPTLPNGTYKITGGTSNVDVFAKVNESGTAKYYYKGETFTISNTNILELVSCRVVSGKTVDETIYPMLVSASETDLSYEPYSNIRPIVGYDNISITRSGKNLFDKNNITVSDLYIEITNSTYNTVSDRSIIIPINPNTTYTVSKATSTIMRVGTSKEYPAVNGKVSVYKSHNTQSNAPLTITSGNEDAWMLVQLFANIDADTNNGTIEANAETLQIEVGSTASAYETFKGNTYIISLGNTYYQGVLDVNRGELVVDKAGYIATGADDEHWEKIDAQGNGLNYYFANIAPANTINADGNTQQCSHYQYGYVVSNNNTQNRFRIYTPTGGQYVRFCIRPDITAYPDITNWKTYLQEQYNAGTPVQVVYELTEPQTIKINPEEIKAISGTNTLYSNADNLYVFGRIDTMKQLQALMERVAALEVKVGV